MATEKVQFDVVGKDVGGSKAFRDVGNAAERAGDQIEDAGDKADGAGDQYRGLAADIEQVEANVRQLAAEIDRTGDKQLFGDLRKQQAELRKLTRVRDLLPDMDRAGEESAVEFSTSFGARIGPLLARIPVGSGGAVAGAALAAAMAPTLGAGIGAALVGGAAGVGVVGGAILAARDQRVKAAGADLGAFLLGDLEKRSSAFVPEMLDAIDDVRAGWTDMGADLTRIFGSARLMEPLVAGAVSGSQRLVAGIADAVDKADPVVASLSATLDGVGDAAGEAFSTVAEDADAGASAVDDLNTATRNFIGTVTGVLHAAAAVKRWSDEVDTAIDRGRFWLEDWVSSGGAMENFGWQLDLTADGFAAGSKEAEAYRAAVTGTATAADFATLKLAGMNDAEIAAADSSGTFRSKLDEVNAALGNNAGSYRNTTQSIEEFIANLERANQLQNEGQNANISAEQANIRLEESIDRATEAAKRNGDGINEKIPKQRANREALLGIAAAAQTAAEKIFATTQSHDLAAQATERGRKKFLETAKAMGVEAGEANRLADQLFGIPEKRKTDVDVKVRQTPIDLSTVASRIAAIKSKRVVVTVVNNTVTTRSEGRNVGIGDGVGGRASGGQVARGQTFWVGENGRELVTFTDNGYVLNSRQSQDIARSAMAASTASAAPAAPAGVGPDDLYRAFVRALQTVPVARTDQARTADLYSRMG
ncbi:hypothetical protein ACGFIG_09295 [Micromonospora sp. NPDC049048]|uniref:hypothetical protein n=1 Tax=Micromonospora sp. NPDC049048 TaxID=3364263 RepID=UPI00371E1DEC